MTILRFRRVASADGAKLTGTSMVTLTSLGSRPRALLESPVLPGLKSSSAFTVLPNRFGMLRAPSMALSPPPQAVRIREVEIGRGGVGGELKSGDDDAGL